ncbi:MAG: hypothetical protein ACI4PQ_00060 [Butyricicoccaceae bacterium]
MDEYGRFLSVVGMAVLILGILVGIFSDKAYSVLYLIAVIILCYCYYRMFSRNIYKRQQENGKFLRRKRTITDRFRQRHTHRFYRCSQCKVTVRVPKGRGRIEITCPKCGNKFIKKS